MLGDVSVRRWRRLVALMTVSVLTAMQAATAHGAPQTLQPLPILATLPTAATPQTPGCNLGTTYRTGFTKEFSATAAADALELLLEAWPSVTVCDGSRVGTARPADGITGQLVDDRTLTELAGPGLRSLIAPIYSFGDSLDPTGYLRGRGLVAGDRVEIPATQAPGGARVWVQAGMGSQPIDIPAGPAATVQVGAAEAQIVQGTSTRTIPIVPLAERLLAVTVRRTDRSLRVVVRGAPNGTNVAISTETVSRKVRVRGGVARASFRSSGKSTDVTAAWSDVASRLVSVTECRSRATTRTRGCAGTPLVRSSAGASAVRRLAVADRQMLTLAHRARASAPRAHAAGARPTFRMKAIKVGRDAQAPVGDVNGDGHADFVDSSAEDSGEAFAELLLSTPTGMAPTGALVLANDVEPIGDLNGDGFAELLLDEDRIAFGTGAIRDLTAASSIGSPGALRLRPRTESTGSFFGSTVGDFLLVDALRSAKVLPDVTGDGQPELATATDRGGLIVGSGQLIRGQTVSLPSGVGDAFRLLTTTTTAGVATAQAIRRATRQRTGQAQITQVDSAATVRRGPELEARGKPVTLIAAPSGGGFALSWMLRDGGTAVMRLDAAGALLAAVNLSGETDVHFGPDGPDADDLPELYLKDDGTLPVVVLQSAVRGRAAGARLPAVAVTDGPKITVNRGSIIASVSGSASLTVRANRPGSFTAPWYRLTPLP